MRADLAGVVTCLRSVKDACMRLCSANLFFLKLKLRMYAFYGNRSGKTEQRKLGGTTDLTHFPADPVDREALPRGGFALFPSSVYEDLINT